MALFRAWSWCMAKGHALSKAIALHWPCIRLPLTKGQHAFFQFQPDIAYHFLDPFSKAQNKHHISLWLIFALFPHIIPLVMALTWPLAMDYLVLGVYLPIIAYITLHISLWLIFGSWLMGISLISPSQQGFALQNRAQFGLVSLYACAITNESTTNESTK